MRTKKNWNKVCIIGGSGTGKTTLTKNLGKELNLPVYHIDGIHHLKNWKIRDKDERDQIIGEIIQKKKWIIDGTYRSTLEQRVKEADIIICLDYSSFAQIKGVVFRYIKNRGKEKEEIPGCREKLTLKFLFWVLNWRRTRRNDIMELLNKIDSNKIYRFKNRRQLNKWYEEMFNKKILL